MKKIRYLIILVLLFVGIKNVYAFDNTIKVYDYALILSNEEEINLKKEVDKYISTNNIDMVIITVRHYNQNNLEDYINEFYTKNELGIGSDKSAIVIAISFKDDIEDIDIKTFGIASDLYSSSEIKDILNNINNKDKYYDKLSTFIEYSNKYVGEFDSVYQDKNILLSINWILIVIVSLIIPTIILLIALLKHKNIIEKRNNNYYVKENSVVITTKADKFLTTNTKKKRLNEKN